MIGFTVFCKKLLIASGCRYCLTGKFDNRVNVIFFIISIRIFDAHSPFISIRLRSNRPQGSTGLPVGECVLERSEGLPAKPVKRSLHSVKVPRACPWVSTWLHFTSNCDNASCYSVFFSTSTALSTAQSFSMPPKSISMPYSLQKYLNIFIKHNHYMDSGSH